MTDNPIDLLIKQINQTEFERAQAVVGRFPRGITVHKDGSAGSGRKRRSVPLGAI